MKYRYVAFDSDGKKVKGVVDAENETGAIYHLRNQDLSPVSVAPYKEKAASMWEIEIMEPDVHKLKIKKKDLMQFADKMSIMLKAGVTLAMAVVLLWLTVCVPLTHSRKSWLTWLHPASRPVNWTGHLRKFLLCLKRNFPLTARFLPLLPIPDSCLL